MALIPTRDGGYTQSQRYTKHPLEVSQPNFSSITGKAIHIPSTETKRGSASAFVGTAFDPSKAFGIQAPSTRIIRATTPSAPISTIQRVEDKQEQARIKAEKRESFSPRITKSRFKDFLSGYKPSNIVAGYKKAYQKGEFSREELFSRKAVSDLGRGTKAYFTAYGFGAVGRGVTIGTLKLFSGGRELAKAGVKRVLPKALTTGKLGGFIGFAGATAEVGLLAKGGAKGTKKISEYKSTTAEQFAIQNKNFKEIMQRGFKAESLSFGSKQVKIPTTEKQVSIPTLKGVVQNIPLVPLFAGKESEFKKSVRADFKAQGYTGKQLEAAVSGAVKQRKAGLIGEGVGVFGANVYSEIFGQKLVSHAFKKVGKVSLRKAPSKLFKTAGFQIGKAGFGEGVASELAMQEGRAEKFSAKKVGLAGVFGFGSAGVIGGGIAATRIGRPTISKIIETGAYITDPFEKPADIFAARTIKGLHLPVLTPAIIIPKGKSVTLTTTPTQTKTKTPTSIKTRTQTKTRVSITPKINIGIPTTPRVPIQILPEVPIPVPVTTPTTIPTIIPINLPTPVSRMMIPPPIPLAFPLGSGKGRRKVGSGVKFINELAIGRKLLTKSLKFKQPTRRITKTRKGKVGTKKRNKGFSFSFKGLNFGF